MHSDSMHTKTQPQDYAVTHFEVLSVIASRINMIGSYIKKKTMTFYAYMSSNKTPSQCACTMMVFITPSPGLLSALSAK